MNTCIIIAAGESTRWCNHLGVPRKHFIPIDNELILHRTVRLLNQYPENKVFVVGHDDEYKIKGSELFVPKEKEFFGHGMDKFWSSAELWNVKTRNIIIYGDCYFTEAAVDLIVNTQKYNWHWFARYGNNNLTGHDSAENFAFSFDGSLISKVRKVIYGVDALIETELYPNRGVILKEQAGGWHVYRLMEGLYHNEHHVGKHWVSINDWSDDFDCPRDYDNFIKRWRRK